MPNEMDGSQEALIRIWVALVEQYKMAEHPSHHPSLHRTDLSEQRPIWTVLINRWILSSDWTVLCSGKRRITRHCIMHVSLLHLNRLLEDDIPFKTELRVRLVDDKDQARVEFRNTMKQTDRTGLLCELHLTLPFRKMPRAVSITCHFILVMGISSFQISYELKTSGSVI